jgi:hypothetical protein
METRIAMAKIPRTPIARSAADVIDVMTLGIDPMTVIGIMTDKVLSIEEDIS